MVVVWGAPKVDWATTDGVTDEDLNRIEGDISLIAGATFDGTTYSLESLKTDYDTHSDETALELKDQRHAKTSEVRMADLPLKLQQTATESGKEDGEIWIYTGT